MKGVLLIRKGSQYSDEPEHHYQFPSQYLKTARTLVGDWVVYNELQAGKGTSGYKRIAQIQDIVPDPNEKGWYLALMVEGTYLEFENFVPYRDGTKFMESRLETGTNKPSQLVRASVREIPELDFFRICHRGNPLDASELPRFGAPEVDAPRPGVREPVHDFNFEDQTFEIERERFSSLVSKPVRLRVFRDRVIRAYNKTCAFTGLSFINGHGRPEVEAAHIRPVEMGGSDRADNGIALSGTVHWMFDRGMISLTDQHDIMVSRQVNDPDQVWKLMTPERKARVPSDTRLQPHPRFLGWHRENVFKH